MPRWLLRLGCVAVAVWAAALIARPGLGSETGSMPEPEPDLPPVIPVPTEELVPAPPWTPPTMDDMGEASFPASDPPAVWTWDPPPPPS